MPKYSNYTFLLLFGIPTGQPFVNGTTVSEIIPEISILVPSFHCGVGCWRFFFDWFIVCLFKISADTYEISLPTPSTTSPQDTVKVSKELPGSYDYHTLRSNPQKNPIYEITQRCLQRTTNRFRFKRI